MNILIIKMFLLTTSFLHFREPRDGVIMAIGIKTAHSVTTNTVRTNMKKYHNKTKKMSDQMTPVWVGLKVITLFENIIDC